MLSATLACYIQEKNYKTIWLALCICIIFFATIMRLGSNPLSFSPDENTYAQQARFIAKNGMSNYDKLINRYLSDESSWILPPPIRLGYLFPLAQIFSLTQTFTPTIGAKLSTVCSLGSLLILFFIAWRFFNPLVTTSSLMLLAVSPMDLEIARRCWSDSLYGFSIAVLFCISCRFFACNKSTELLLLAFYLTGIYISLVKENGIALLAYFTACIVVAYIHKKKSFFEISFFPIIALSSASIALSLLLLATSGFEPLKTILLNIQQAVYNNGYAQTFQNGPWYLFFRSLWIMSPISLILFCFSPLALLGKNTSYKNEPNTPKHIILCSLVFIIILTFSLAFLPFLQNLRYFSVGYVPYYLLAGVGTQSLHSVLEKYFKRFFPYLPQFVVITIIVISIVNDISTFQHFSIKNGGGDLSAKLVIEKNS